MSARGGKRTLGDDVARVRLAGQLKDMLRRKFKEALFLWRLLRARFAEFQGDFEEARRRLQHATAPERYVALRGAYDARLVSLQFSKTLTEGVKWHQPEEVLRLISEIQTRRWYWSPKDENERYAARYVDYLELAVLGEEKEREELATQLRAYEPDRLLKNVLLVT